MALIRWKNAGDLAPWSVFSDVQGELSRLMDDLGCDWNTLGRTWRPAMDLVETDDAFVLEADLPGVASDDIHIETVDNTITTRGKRDYAHKETDRNVHRQESRYGEFQRTFDVPGGFDSDNVKAELRDGVLRVTLPKRETSKPKRIELTVN